MRARIATASVVAALATGMYGTASAVHTDRPLLTPRAVVATTQTRIDKRFYFKLRIRCIGRRGSVCSGWAGLSTGKPALYLEEGVPLTGTHNFRLGAGKARSLRMRLTSYARPDRSRWREARSSRAMAVVYSLGPPSRRMIDVRFKPRPRSRAGG